MTALPPGISTVRNEPICDGEEEEDGEDAEEGEEGDEKGGKEEADGAYARTRSSILLPLLPLLPLSSCPPAPPPRLLHRFDHDCAPCQASSVGHVSSRRPSSVSPSSSCRRAFHRDALPGGVLLRENMLRDTLLFSCSSVFKLVRASSRVGSTARARWYACSASADRPS